MLGMKRSSKKNKMKKIEKESIGVMYKGLNKVLRNHTCMCENCVNALKSIKGVLRILKTK